MHAWSDFRGGRFTHNLLGLGENLAYGCEWQAKVLGYLSWRHTGKKSRSNRFAFRLMKGWCNIVPCTALGLPRLPRQQAFQSSNCFLNPSG